jgi:hypothetical protein
MTILFADDWKSYPEAIVDDKTKNTSFIRMAALYRDMGVKNHAFPLALHNPELQGVNPYDFAKLTVESMAAILYECKVNYWYYLREIARVPGGAVTDPIPYRANRGGIALPWLFFNHMTFFLIQPRQTGKSFSSDVLDSYLLNIAMTFGKINLLTKDDKLRSSNLIRLKDIIDELPFYLNQRKRGDIANTEKLIVGNLNNAYEGHLPNKSPKMALNVGRGLTSAVFKVDEIAFLPNVGITLPAALASTTAARALAKRKNEPYGNIFTTTAGKKDDPDGKFAYDLMMGSAVWTEKLLDCVNIDDLYRIVRRNSPKGEARVNCTFSHRQLGYTDQWLKETLEITGSKGEDADRDFFNIWTAGSLTSPFTVEQSERIRKSERLDYHAEMSSQFGYITRWYIPANEINARMARGHYSMGLDTSDAAGGDDIGLVLRDVQTGEIVAAGNYNETNLILFAQWLVEWFIRFENFTCIIERRSSGSAIIDYLLLMLPSKGINPFKRLYNKVVQLSVEDPTQLTRIDKLLRYNQLALPDLLVEYKRDFGFATSGSGLTSRTDLYSNTLQSATRLSADSVHDVKMIDQMLSLVIKNGRVDHADGSNDDLVIAWLLSFWLISKGTGLTHYGINSKDILAYNKQNTQDNDPVKLRQQHQQNQLRITIENTVDEIRREKDTYIIHRLEQRLRHLASGLSDQDKKVFSVDELIQNIRDSKKYKKI